MAIFASIVQIFRPLVRAAGVCAIFFSATVASASDEVDFSRDIQPILSENCYHCHGPDRGSRKADLRFDQYEGALAPAKSGKRAIVPGKAEESELLKRVLSTDPAVQMPPPESNRKVSKRDAELLKKWIEQGAKWGKHWSFNPPQRPELPAVKNEQWARNAIDRFILARLEKENLQPSAPASKEKLLRRVTLELTGLPPTLEEIDAFVADTSPDAYEKVVDRLLASRAYGERMVSEWLDAARYADSNGYQADPVRTSWPWRDWVINAMNANMPYDQFVIEQLAGDLLPNPTRDQRLATAFNRNHPFNGEGGRIPDETRVENVLDRVDTFGTVFLGMTIACARCHDHKYDPITQKDYFQLYAYFNQSSETGEQTYVNGGNVPPVLPIATPQQEKTLAKLKKEFADARAALKTMAAESDRAQPTWEAEALARLKSPTEWKALAPATARSEAGAVMTTLDDKSVLVSGKDPGTDVHQVVIHPGDGEITGIRIEALTHPNLPQAGPGRASNGNFVLSGLEVQAASKDDPKALRVVDLAFANATYQQGNFDPQGLVDGSSDGWAVMDAPDKNALHATIAFREPIRAGALHITLRYESGNRNHTMGHFRISVAEGSLISQQIATILKTPADKRTEDQKNQLRDYYRSNFSAGYAQKQRASARASKQLRRFEKSITHVMVMNDAMPRKTHLLKRGAYDQPGQELQPGTPEILNPLPTNSGKNNRLALARWLVDPANPLFARVAVNRYWQSFFGTGLVKTVEDFGLQGEKPTHPELLDWLAVEFRESGWNVKAMHRLIVTSNAYRQDSAVSPELLEKDPANRLLARGPRYRLSSFAIRDQALAASGLLVTKVGGPPVKTYQPPGIWEEMSLDQIKYEQDHGEALWRRSVYTFWRRTVAPTITFDVPQRSVCSVRTMRTNTPLHALAILNDTTYVEASRVLAEKLLTDAEMTSDESRIVRAFRLSTSRPPRDEEKKVLLGALERLRKQYGEDVESARKLVSIGEKSRVKSLDVPELAAWTSVVSMMLNLDETITQE